MFFFLSVIYVHHKYYSTLTVNMIDADVLILPEGRRVSATLAATAAVVSADGGEGGAMRRLHAPGGAAV